MKKADIEAILSEVTDPEIPVLSIREIGILRSVDMENGRWKIVITPTYSGCPAMHAIELQTKLTLLSHGIENADVVTELSPSWTTDWMTTEAKKKLEKYGIAPPNPPKDDEDDRPKNCPVCKSKNVEEVSRFGSTSCKSLWKCIDCLEPFDYFKCH